MQGLPLSLFGATKNWSPYTCLLEMHWIVIPVDICGCRWCKPGYTSQCSVPLPVFEDDKMITDHTL